MVASAAGCEPLGAGGSVLAGVVRLSAGEFKFADGRWRLRLRLRGHMLHLFEKCA